jgi:hypothetical protein
MKWVLIKILNNINPYMKLPVFHVAYMISKNRSLQHHYCTAQITLKLVCVVTAFIQLTVYIYPDQQMYQWSMPAKDKF